MNTAILLIVKLSGLLLLAPLLQGIIKRVKAVLQGRQGPGILQPFRDVTKLLGKRRVISRETSWVFGMAPIAAFAAVITASLMIPWISPSPWGYMADLLLFVYLLAIPRFVMALAGLDASGSFGGMSSSREMAVSALAEPALLLALLTLALPAHSLDLHDLIWKSTTVPVFTPAGLLAGVAFFVVVVSELGRIPVDNPDTHLELTMIHEGMVLEYSGPQLALIHITYWVKQVSLVLLLVNAFAPFGFGVAATAGDAVPLVGWLLVKLAVAGIALALTETLLAKLRLFQMMDLMGLSLVLSITALLFMATGG
ncbi:MAG TPA: NADH-quinone oxidoreductase subunit H [Candidatus Ozemobacteraceae bacterium]